MHTVPERKLAILPFAIILLLVVTIFRAQLGATAWEMFRAPSVALFLNPDSALALEAGNYYFNVGDEGRYDLEKAETYFLKALALDPLASDAWHQLARIDFLRGDFDNALLKINNQLSLHGDSLMSSYYIRGLIYAYDGDLKSAEKDFLKFYEWDRTNWAVYNDLAWVYFREGEFQKAKRVADGGLAYHPNNPWLLNMAGVSRMNLGDAKSARIYFQKALWWLDTMTESDWHRAYPGNAPYTAGQGIAEMKEAVRANLNLVVDKR